MELVSALKEDVASSSLAAHVVKTKQAEGVFVVDVEEHFLVNLRRRFPLPHPRVRQVQAFHPRVMPMLHKRH